MPAEEAIDEYSTNVQYMIDKSRNTRFVDVEKNRRLGQLEIV